MFLSQEARLLRGGCIKTVSVLVLYSPEAASAVANINQTIDEAIVQLNGAMSNSGGGQNLKFKLAGKTPYNYNGGSNLKNNVTTLAQAQSAQNLRSSYKADIVVLLTDNSNYEDDGLAGQAKEINALQADAYAIVQAKHATSSITFVHEVGHLMGGRHQQCSVAPGSNCDDNPSKAHGYHFNAADNNTYSTIMHQLGYGSRILMFSGPTNLYIGAYAGKVNNNVISELLANTCRIASYNIDQADLLNGGTFKVDINGPSDASAYAYVYPTAVVSGAPGAVSYQWLNSFDGFSYYGFNAPNSASVTAQMNDEDDLWLKVKATSNGLIATNFHKVKNLDNPYLRLAPGGSSGKLEVFPQPATQKELTYVVYVPKETQQVKSAVIDLTERVVRSYEFNASSKTTVLSQKLSLEGIEGGLYFLKVQAGTEVFTRTILIAN